MNSNFPAAVPEIPVLDLDKAIQYYERSLGFKKDWRSDDDGIAGISNGDCRLFLTDPSFRQPCGNAGPVLIWLNLHSKEEVNSLYERWKNTQARFISKPEEKAWNLHEFTATDLDGNLLRVFYDFTRHET